jgi:hypothetical protein
MPDLDRSLRAARTDLLDEIRIPELAGVQARAAGIRRRRHGVIAAAAAVVLMAAGTGTALLANRAAPDRHEVSATTPPAPETGWRGGGLTLEPLTAKVLDLPGDLYDVEFTDRQHGYALAADCATSPCLISFAYSEDGGDSWEPSAPPQTTAPSGTLPHIVPVAVAAVVVRYDKAAYFFDAPYRQWSERPAPPGGVSAVLEGARVWLPPGTGACQPGPVQVWRIDGTQARLDSPPAIQGCTVAAGGPGTWWVGGRSAGVPAVAVSSDSGRTWSTIPLPAAEGAPDAWAQVSTLGNEVYVSVVDMDATGSLRLHNVYRGDGGDSFVPYPTSVVTLGGEVVPLLDGRLVVGGPEWMVSAGAGRPFVRAGGTMPLVGALRRTPAGWIAYDLFDDGWVAISTDGSTWQKVNLR